jgi:hypothetical protein
VERYIKTIEEHLQKVVTSHHIDWDEKLTLFLLAYRASTYDTTRLTPASLGFGENSDYTATCYLEYPQARKDLQPIMRQT